MQQDTVESRGKLSSAIEGFRNEALQNSALKLRGVPGCLRWKAEGEETKAKAVHAAVLTLANPSGLPHFSQA